MSSDSEFDTLEEMLEAEGLEQCDDNEYAADFLPNSASSSCHRPPLEVLNICVTETPESSIGKENVRRCTVDGGASGGLQLAAASTHVHRGAPIVRRRAVQCQIQTSVARRQQCKWNPNVSVTARNLQDRHALHAEVGHALHDEVLFCRISMWPMRWERRSRMHMQIMTVIPSLLQCHSDLVGEPHAGHLGEAVQGDKFFFENTHAADESEQPFPVVRSRSAATESNHCRCDLVGKPDAEHLAVEPQEGPVADGEVGLR